MAAPLGEIFQIVIVVRVVPMSLLERWSWPSIPNDTASFYQRLAREYIAVWEIAQIHI